MYLVKLAVVNGSSDWMFMAHDSVFNFRLHHHQGQLTGQKKGKFFFRKFFLNIILSAAKL